MCYVESVKHLVLIGGGHSHVQVLKKLAQRPIHGVSVSLISPEARQPYSGMLPGYVAGHYTENDIYIDLLHTTDNDRYVRQVVQSGSFQLL